MKLYYSFLLLIFLMACQTDRQDQSTSGPSSTQSSGPVFELLPESASGITFRNDITESPQLHGLMWDALYYGGGVGIGDIDNDGLDDLFFAGNQNEDALYLNEGDLKFKDISESSGITVSGGWSTGVAMVDINNDGFLDIYVCRSSWNLDNIDPEIRRNKLYINNGDLTFSEQAADYGLDNDGYSTQATFFDYDKDGDLDMFLLNSPSNNLSQKVVYGMENKIPEFTSDRFYRNEGGKYIDVSAEVGVMDQAFGLGVIAADLNHDTWPDLYVANDYDRPDFLYINQKNGTFRNMLDEKIKHTSFTSMGCDAADINNDGLVDLGVLDMQSSDHVRSKTNMPSMNIEQFWGYVNKGYNYQYMSNVLQLNNGMGYFSDIAQYAGIASTDWSWAILMADFNNDFHKDILVTNGINKDLRNNDFTVRMDQLNQQGNKIDIFELSKEIPSTPTKNYMFQNKGAFKFANVTDQWGLDQKTFSYGAAYGDLDNDGDLDLVVNNNNERAYLYKNTSDGSSNYLKVSFENTAKNKKAVGAKVFLFSGESICYQEVMPIRGYLSSCSPELIFGLGSLDVIDSLVCIFPDDRSIRMYDVSPNQNLTFKHEDAQKQPLNIYNFGKPLFASYTGESGIDHAHIENVHNDFEHEILLPHSESTKGPYTAVGDVNGDQLDDLFIGGASGQAGTLYIQSSKGTFTKQTGPWEVHAALEDMGCALIDRDGDGDLDLYIASGGNASSNPHDYHDRMYDNDGRGNFTGTTNVLPELHSNSSCVVPCDYDGDGDMDLFVGGLVEVGRYPYPGQSVLLQNNNGVFTDITTSVSSSLSSIGMVTDAEWGDINDDGRPDLVVVGEWMSPTAFINSVDSFSESKHWMKDYENLTGWYMSISTADLNGDNKPDFVLGNFGTNNKFHPSVEKPLKVYSSDFDDNNTNDIVLAKNYKGKYVPVRGRECSSQQMPFVAEKFETFSEFANASIETIFEEKLDGSLALEVREFRSGVALSGTSGYDFQPFPAQAQFFPVMSSMVKDFDGDQVLDILLTGNLFDAEVETTRHDSGNGLILLGSKDGGYQPLPVLSSGYYAPFNSRHLALLNNNGVPGSIIVTTANNNRTVTYRSR